MACLIPAAATKCNLSRSSSRWTSCNFCRIPNPRMTAKVLKKQIDQIVRINMLPRTSAGERNTDRLGKTLRLWSIA